MNSARSIRNGFASPLLVLGILAGVLALGVAIQTHRVESCKTEFAAFKAQVKQLGEQAEKEARAKEKANEKRIADANNERDAALKRLRDRERSRSRNLSSAAAPANSGNRVCIPTATYNSAMGEFREVLARVMAEVDGYATRGDEAAIDADTLIKAWPRQSPPAAR